jgi:hypothetical protein
MVNEKAGMKFAVVSLPKLEAERLCRKSVGKKGHGVFLKKGITIDKNANVMIYGGRACDSSPHNDYSFKISDNSFLDASNAADCVEKGELCLRKCTPHCS